MEKKRIELEIFFTLYGFQIFSWKGLLKTVTGLSFVQIKLQECMSATVQNSKNFTLDMNKKEEEIRQSKLKKFGKPLSKVKLKPAPHTCFLKITRTLNLTNKIWELSKALIYVAKSLNTPQKRKLQFAI